MNGNEMNALNNQLNKAKLVYPILMLMVAQKVSKSQLARLTGIDEEHLRKGLRNPAHMSVEEFQLCKDALDSHYTLMNKE